ncbi:MAG: M61 family peptidase [Terriglobia bacterium]|jgi:predicted metalloprotease with PDZ domain
MLSARFRLSLILVMLVASSASWLNAQSRPTITLTVDATQAPEKIIRTRMVMPAKPGPLTLYYPKWIPGEHEPTGPVGNVAGLKFTANGKTIPWRRDLLDVFTFHVDVPQGADSLEAEFEYLEPPSGGFSAGASATDKLVVVSWNQDLFYPAGLHADQITFKPTLRLPEGWKYGTALPVENASGNEVTFKPVALDHLVDSPVIAGEFYRAVDVTPPGEPIHHEIDMVADSAAALEMPPELQKKFTNLVAETGKLFGARHYREYHFLLTLSDHVAHFGLEHHESNDSRTGERALLSPPGQRGVGGLLSHEFMHSWNGKFRRPAGLSTPEYETPMQTDLLWVYEGLTDFLGPLLAARSGLSTAEQYRDNLASIAADLGPGRPGRTWRPLQDTADAIPGMFRGAFGGESNWKRGADYYPEGDLLWLEVAMIIRRESQGKKSIEDFCHAFHGGPNNGPELKPYTFDELVSTLNGVVAYDWANFLRERVSSTSPAAPVGGIEMGGWKVEFNDKPPERGGGGGAGGRFGGGVDARYSIGLRLGGDGSVADSIWGGLAYQAGILPGMRVVAINDRAFTTDLLADALKASKTSAQTIRFLVLNEDYYSTHTINYQGGEKYPHLVRAEGKPDLLDDLAKPLARPPEPEQPSRPRRERSDQPEPE